MKKLLILIVLGALFLHYYPQPEVDEWYEEQKEFLVNKFTEATDTQIRISVQKVMDDLQSDMQGFSEDELEYIKGIAADRGSIKTFFNDYCQNKEYNEILEKAHLNKVCQTMNQYSSLM